MTGLGDAGAAVRRATLVGSALALVGATAYGINIVGARLCAQLGISGSDIVVYRAFLFLPLLAGLALWRGQRLALSPGNRAPVFRFAVFSVATALFYMSSLAYLPVPIAVTIFYTYPLIVILLSPYVDRVPLSLRRWVVALVAFAGVLLAVGPEAHRLDPRGVVLALFGSAACAGMFISAARVETDSSVTFFWCQICALPLGLGFAHVMGGLSEPAVLMAGLAPLLVNVAGYFIGFLLQIMAAARISPATAGLLFLFEPVVAILAAALVLSETLTLAQTVGIALVVGALAFDLLPHLRRSEPITPFEP
ncbi:MAG TPA: DMT family transporter [Beijerinckiaceae bacterium]|nr:DMT family transporter [Beijerinckiaceae bacterium]